MRDKRLNFFVAYPPARNLVSNHTVLSLHRPIIDTDGEAEIASVPTVRRSAGRRGWVPELFLYLLVNSYRAVLTF